MAIAIDPAEPGARQEPAALRFYVGWLALGLALVAGLGLVDHFTGPEIAFAFFYLIPVSLVAWNTSRALGVAISVASALVWLVADTTSGGTYSHWLIPYWNTTTRLGFFLVVTFLLCALREALRREQEMARTDHLTGALNARAFEEESKNEISRSARYGRPFSVAYLDVDNFKQVNDRLGHRTGDEVLRAVASTVRAHLRRSDRVARLGGDEFAILLPESGQASARGTIEKVLARLSDQATERGWPITFSVGVLTCLEPPGSVDEMIRLADEAMYRVKNHTKNDLAFVVLGGQPAVRDV